MKSVKALSVTTKIVLLSTVLAAIFLGATIFSILFGVNSLLEDTLFSSTKISSQANSVRVDAQIESIQNTLTFLSATPPIQGMFRAEDAGGFDSEGSSTLLQWENRLATIFNAEIRAQDIIDHIRYIDETGMEQVRSNRFGQDGVKVEEQDLQDKSDTEYFQDSVGLGATEMYVSDITLNREGEDRHIEIPYKPVIRFATPVFDEVGVNRGILIINVDFNKLLSSSNLVLDVNSTYYALDTVGSFLEHPDPQKEWGGDADLGTGITVYSEFPGIFSEPFTEGFGEIITTSTDAFVIDEVSLNKNKSFYLLTQIDIGELLGPIYSFTQGAAAAGLIIFIILFFVFLFVIRKLLSPLARLTDAAKSIGKGDFDQHVDVQSEDEIGLLGNTVNAMASQLKDSYQELQFAVDEKTEDLKNKVGQLQKTKTAMFNIIDDLDEEKAAVTLERDKIQTILESIGDAVFVVNQDLEITMYNRIAEKISRVPKDEALGKNYTEVFHFQNEETGERNSKFIENVFSTGKIQEMENHTELVRTDGTKIAVADSAAPLKDLDGNVIGAVVVFRDVTKERQIDKAKTEFVSLASHQLRTPLTSIRWYLELLQSGDAGELTEAQREYINEAHAGTTRMNDLVRSLLNVSRIELGKFMIEPEETDIPALMQQMINEQKPAITEKGHTVDFSADATLPHVLADPKILANVFQNLVSNAVKYTPNNGQITVNIVAKKAGDQFGGRELDEGVLAISVADNGQGIPKKEHEHIFEKLYRAENAKASDTEGTGLGLYIARQVVQEAGGDVWFESEQDKGTTFFLVIPLTGMKKRKGSKMLEM